MVRQSRGRADPWLGCRPPRRGPPCRAAAFNCAARPAFPADLVITHALEWPSLTVQWLGDLKEENTEGGYSKQQLILGTHTSEGEQNYLMRAEVQLPLEETETDNR